MLTRATKRAKLEKDRLEKAESADSFARLPLALVASIVSFFTVKEHVGIAAVLSKALLAACKSSLSWPSHADFFPVRVLPSAKWARTWNCLPLSVRFRRFVGGLGADEVWRTVRALCARAHSVHVENANRSDTASIDLCKPERFNDKDFPALRVLKLRDDAFEEYTDSLMSLWVANVSHAHLSELELASGLTHQFRWDRGKLPRLKRLSLRVHSSKELHESVLPVLGEVALKSFFRSLPELLAKLQQCPLRPGVSLVGLEDDDMPPAIEAVRSAGLSLFGLIAELGCSFLAYTDLKPIQTLERVVLGYPQFGHLLSLPRSLRHLSLQWWCISEQECDWLLSWCDEGCAVHLLHCSIKGDEHELRRLRDRHPRSYDAMMRGVRFVGAR